MSKDRKICSKCPWIDPTNIPETVKQVALENQWFCCHTRMGQCEGAKQYGLNDKEASNR